MEALPLLVLESVCEYLAHGEPRKTSLLAFASRFLQISINIKDGYFPQSLERVERMLDETQSRTCVRVLNLGWDRALYYEPYEMLMTPEKRFCASCPLQNASFEGKKPRDARWWKPLVRFLSSIHLKDVIWASQEQVPRCILSVLNEQIPRCRLHVYGFDLRSLHQSSKDSLQNINDTEFLLATSPCLYNIITANKPTDNLHCDNYNDDAILQLAAGMASNLKHVLVWDQTITPSGEFERGKRHARLDWRGFRPQSDSEWCATPITKGQLHSLTIDPRIAIFATRLTLWQKHIDFSVLRTLTLANRIELGALQILVALAQQDGLCHLKALDLPVIHEDHEEADSTIARLLSLLNPLADLGVVAVGDCVYEAALKQHGGSLQVFRVKDTVLSAQQVTQLRESCPKIRKLSIEILRSAGDQVEVKTYRNLGSMRYLESLSLVLHCIKSLQLQEIEEAKQVSNRRVRKAKQVSNHRFEKAFAVAYRQGLINAAVDKTLAMSIFRTIFDAHTYTKAYLPPKLTSIQLRVNASALGVAGGGLVLPRSPFPHRKKLGM
ncbi:hypothetical protein C7974DRAFT_467455 [Boeremia exigua]|uniref:uncharacterized protein n=1 Tax=Boeremia exigua TaxID=749465 RepID=UPI001E8CBE6E|nr:uncharacterized protein C7974DRAFT_467455 [Boeremia exigua]KAH6643667.1 hypothetical protein C7974DRAFT_467455 [Boeremia exigua]